MDLHFGELGRDVLTVLMLVVLEGLLSGDNALVLAVIVMPLPPDQQRKALKYGLIGAFVLRIIATVFAVYLVQVTWVRLVGGLYLLYLPFKHFTAKGDHGGSESQLAAGTRTFLGLSLFWTIVVKADLIDLVFAVDSILAAVGMTKKVWIIITGGLLGILMMRMLTMQVVAMVERWPKLIDGAYIIIAWVGVKLLAEYAHAMHWIHWEIHEGVAIGVVVVLFVASVLYAKAHAVPLPEADASESEHVDLSPTSPLAEAVAHPIPEPDAEPRPGFETRAAAPPPPDPIP